LLSSGVAVVVVVVADVVVVVVVDDDDDDDDVSTRPGKKDVWSIMPAITIIVLKSVVAKAKKTNEDRRVSKTKGPTGIAVYNGRFPFFDAPCEMAWIAALPRHHSINVK
jgi:hypothetical protein